MWKLLTGMTTIFTIGCMICVPVSADDSGLSTSSIAEQFLSGWSTPKAKPSINTHCSFFGESSNGINFWKASVDRALEGSGLSKAAKYEVLVQNSSDSLPHYQIASSSGTLADKFYLEQAIWEAAPFRRECANAHGTCTFSDVEDSSTKSTASDFDGTVVFHVIPLSVNWKDRYPGLFWDEELKSPCNVKTISLSQVDSDLLRAYRMAWVKYFSTPKEPPTRADILQFASSLLTKYDGLFKK